VQPLCGSNSHVTLAGYRGARDMEELSQILIKNTDGQQRGFVFRSASVGDQGVVRQIFQNGDYNLATFARNADLQAYCESRVTAGGRPLIVDAGANIGASPVFFCYQFPNCRVIAIEPEQKNMQLMRQNCAGLDVVFFQAALGAQSGTAYLSDPGHSDWGFRVGDQGDLAVPMMCMADLLSDPVSAGYFPLLCKIDIEGGEAGLFAQRTEWVDAFPLLIIELHDWLFPGSANSRNFLRAISSRNFDFVYRGENAFCFNNALLERHT
jgi:FkbM family methyltransferase